MLILGIRGKKTQQKKAHKKKCIMSQEEVSVKNILYCVTVMIGWIILQ